MEIKILGTKSPRCYKEHNCVGHLIKHGDNNIILDLDNDMWMYICNINCHVI